MDSPIDGQRLVAGAVAIRGWAAVVRGKVVGVIITKNGSVAAKATLGLPRPDVTTVFRGLHLAEECGWTAQLDLSDADSPATLSVHVFSDGFGSRCLSTISVNIVDGEPSDRIIPPDWLFGALDKFHRSPGSKGRYVLEGWAIDSRGPIRGLAVMIDQKVVGCGELGIRRDDVAQQFESHPGALEAGWRVETLAIPKEVDSQHSQLRILVMGCEGEWATLTQKSVKSLQAVSKMSSINDGRVDFPNSAQPVERDALNVKGWALVQGSLPKRVDINVGESISKSARLGIPRRDIFNLHRVFDATISGFEQIVDLSSVRPEIPSVVLKAIAYGLDGSSFPLPEVNVTLTTRPTHNKQLAELSSPPPRAPSPMDGAASDDINLLVFTHDLGYGGGQLYLFDLLEGLTAREAISCTVVAPNDGPLKEKLEALGIRVHVTTSFPLDNWVMYEAKMLELAAWVEDGEFDAVLVNTMGAFPGADLSRRLGLPYAWAIHESFEPAVFWAAAFPPSYLDPNIRALAEESLRHASALVFEAESTRRQFANYAEQQRTHVVHYGIDLSPIEKYRSTFRKNQGRRAYGIPQDAFVLLSLGTIEPRKGQIMLAKAFVEVADDYPKSILVMVGARNDTHSNTLREYVELAGLDGRVLVQELTPETFFWYGVADLFVCSSDIESLPRSVLEAMAFEIPVLATNIFGLSELISDGETGCLMEPCDLSEVIQALRRILSSPPALLAEIGRAGAALIEAEYQIKGYTQWYESFFKQVKTAGSGSGLSSSDPSAK